MGRALWQRHTEPVNGYWLGDRWKARKALSYSTHATAPEERRESNDPPRPLDSLIRVKLKISVPRKGGDLSREPRLTVMLTACVRSSAWNLGSRILMRIMTVRCETLSPQQCSGSVYCWARGPVSPDGLRFTHWRVFETRSKGGLSWSSKDENWT